MTEDARNRFRRIVVFGPQGSGKGTQSRILSQELGIPKITPGEIFRKNIQACTPLGKLAAQYINDGHLVPNDITNALVRDRLSEPDASSGFLLDGYPRNESQYRAIMEITRLHLALELWISDREAIARINKRRECQGCGKTYFDPLREKEPCDRCGGKLVQREDDQPEAVRRRLEIYHKETELLKTHYQKTGILLTINGEQPILAVTQNIIERLDALVKTA